MISEFTDYCNQYYQLTTLFEKHGEHFKNLLDTAPVYCGQNRLSEVDALISYYREAQAYKAKMDKTLDDLRETEQVVLTIMRHFEIPPGTVLTGEIPYELEYEIWADEDDALHISKTKDLAPEVENPDIMVIKFSGEVEGED